MANDLKHLLARTIHLKLTSFKSPMACMVKNVEELGLWVSGSPILQAVVQSGAVLHDPPPGASTVIFVPFHSVEWFAMAEE